LGNERTERGERRVQDLLRRRRARALGDTQDGGPMQRETREPANEGSPVEILKTLPKRVSDDDVLGLSAEMAYRFLFAVFPFGLFVAALGAFVASALRIDNPAQQIISGLGDNLPSSLAQGLQPELERLVSSPRADLLSIGALAALWAATSGTNALVKGIHRAYGIPESRPLVMRYAVAIGLTLLGAVGMIASFVTIIGGALLTQELAERLGVGQVAFATIQLLRWPAIALVLIGAVAVVYRYAPNVVVPWRWILTGSVVFTLGWLVATGLLGLYVSTIGNYGATYGSLAGVIVMMLWFYVTAAMLLLGAEVTAAVAQARTPGLITVRREEQEAAAAVEAAAVNARKGMGGATKNMPRQGSARPT
jgi:membrane protein